MYGVEWRHKTFELEGIDHVIRIHPRALHKAHYEYVEEDGCYFASIPGLKGIWADGDTLEECRKTLAEVIEDWVLAHIALGVEVPECNGVTVGPKAETVAELV